jgi:ribonuclease HIII
MLFAKDKFSFFNQLKRILSENGFLITPYKEIQYGIQFQIELDEQFGMIRIYEGKNGIRLDLSQVKNKELAEKIGHLVSASDNLVTDTDLEKIPTTTKTKTNSHKANEASAALIKDPEEIIGIDESGKGDYFGPLCVAAVHVNQAIKNKLENLGVTDSKKLDDKKIVRIAVEIKKLCPHSLVIMGNKSYNEVYERMQNLNHILAWAHARVLENTLEQVPCKYALSDQFGNAQLINNALMPKGKNIILMQRPKAESNIAVAAASILARDAFIENLKKMGEAFSMEFPKGCSPKTMSAAETFVEKYGKDSLLYVAKLHFNLTDKLKDNPDKPEKNNN